MPPPILALGGEGSTSATSLTLTDDGSNTILYATALSDSLLSDWQNLTTINLTGTSGFVTLTGAEATNAEGGSSGFESYGFGGLLTDVGLKGTDSYTSGLTIEGGNGNSFYDLSSLTLTAAHLSKIDGGHSTAGNSEVAFNNSVVANATGSIFGGESVELSHIQILDDASSTQGGAINLANFGPIAGDGNTGLEGLNQNYALISEDNATTATGQTVVPDGLPFTSTASPPVVVETGAAAAVAGLSNDVIPTGYEVLQLLNNEGSTATTQTANLAITNGPWDFAVNAQDVANGWSTTGTPDTTGAIDLSAPVLTPLGLDGYNLSIQAQNLPPASSAPNVTVTDTLRYYVSDGGVSYNVSSDNSAVITNQGPNPDVGGSFTLSDTPHVQIANYTTADFFLPYESLPVSTSSGGSDPGSPYHNYVVLGSTSFSDTPVVVADNGGSVLNASLNFYDNQTDTGGSDPGGPDNLVLGHTNFAYNPSQSSSGLGIADIGVDTVNIDANTVTTTNADYGAGSFEIGATNASILEAASTSHLIQDVSATLDYYTFNSLTGPEGITVTGSATGQNLLQGTSGWVSDTGYGSSSVGIGGNGVTGGTLGDVLQARIQTDGSHGGYGNDVLDGGAGGDGVTFTETGGFLGTYTGNSGDNFFPEGGVDTVNIGGLNSSGAAIGASNATTWFGAYDVSNSGDYLGITENSGVGHIYGQAITTIVGGVESYVDGYGGSNLVTINGFEPFVGSTAKTGDIINLDAPDWAKGSLNGGLTDQGLAQANGASIATLHNADATTFEVGKTTGLGSTVLNGNANLILDAFGPYANSNHLVAGLESAGAFTLPTIAGHSVEHLLVAYQNTGGGVNIDDVTLTNTGGAKILPSTASLDPTATDLITLTGVELSQLQTGHNFHFV